MRLTFFFTFYSIVDFECRGRIFAKSLLLVDRADDDSVFKWSDYFGDENTLFVVDAKKKGNVGR